jgi:uncharacterized repeat protein (TIGR03803 family)
MFAEFFCHRPKRILVQRRSPASHFPCLEVLEDRLTPSISLVTVTSFSNVFSGGGTSAASPAVDDGGNLFDTTQNGGTNNTGTVFEWVKAANSITTLASFPANAAGTNAYSVNPGLVRDSSGNLYGTYSGGPATDGAVFKLAAGSNTIQTLATFDFSTTGSGPGALLLDGNTLYGTTFQGGVNGNYGTVFSLPTAGGTPNVLASFSASTPFAPRDGLTLSGGTLYGTTKAGGASNQGAVFSVPVTGGAITVLGSFSGDVGGGDGGGGKLLVLNGNVYGTERAGPGFGGDVFEVAAGSGTVTRPASFSFGLPDSGLIRVGNTILGTTETGGPVNHGSVFAFDPASGTVTTLAAFNGGNGGSPFNSLSVDNTGNVYGTALGEGGNTVVTLFELSGLNVGATVSFIQQPTDGFVNGPLNPAVQLRVTDTQGQPATGGSVTLTLAGNPAGVTLSGATATPVGGVATFANLSVNTAGTYSLVAASSFGAGGTTSVPFFAQTAAVYANAVYQDLLGRPPDSTGLAYWSARLTSGEPRTIIANLLTHSAEYFGTVIQPAYQKFLGRTPDAAGLAFWIGRMQAGLTDEQLEAGFIASPEYYAHNGSTDKGWIDGTYQDLLGRPADAAGEAYWIAQAAAQSRFSVALGFAVSTERERQHVTADYQKYLGRTPDSGGLDYWTDQFINHGQTNEDLITGFLASDEYLRRGTP